MRPADILRDFAMLIHAWGGPREKNAEVVLTLEPGEAYSFCNYLNLDVAHVLAGTPRPINPGETFEFSGISFRIEKREETPRAYRCGACGTSDRQRYQRCNHPGCPDGRDQR